MLSCILDLGNPCRGDESLLFNMTAFGERRDTNIPGARAIGPATRTATRILKTAHSTLSAGLRQWGLYQQGVSPEGVLDLAGNVWEWCLNEYHAPENTQLAGDEGRVVRGGSWLGRQVFARATCRDVLAPGSRRGSLGLRVARSSPGLA